MRNPIKRVQAYFQERAARNRFLGEFLEEYGSSKEISIGFRSTAGNAELYLDPSVRPIHGLVLMGEIGPMIGISPEKLDGMFTEEGRQELTDLLGKNIRFFKFTRDMYDGARILDQWEYSPAN